MKTNSTLATLLLTLYSCALFGLQEYDIRFKLDNLDCQTGQVCYLIQLRSSDGQGWNLAGQNYRIYYDASKASYRSESGLSLLPSNQYSSVLLTADIQNVNASAFGGQLPFESTLSFLNFSIDLMNLSNGGINLPASGEWVNTSQLCFDVTQEVLDNPSECLNIIWARTGLTDEYATAFVEVSQWLSANSTTEAIASVYDDLDENDGSEACLTSSCGGAGNENTDQACSDGVDNDEDGLVDCNDPDCELTNPCMPDPKAYDIVLDLASVDCVSGNACYEIQLRSGVDPFVLGTQRYRLFYNTAVGTFSTVVSQLTNGTFQAVTLNAGTPVENQNQTGIGPLDYDDDLGFIDFSIDLTDFQNGSGITVNSSSFTTTALICFEMTSDAINDADVCFDATWARNGLTDNYNSGFVEIEEWLSESQTFEVSGSNYSDISAASGNSACFDVTCGSDNEVGDPLCSDGIDNDDDGLVDCQDPGCSQSSTCLSSCDAQAPTISGN